ncbi:uncharacterized protein E0L32_001870 [Thyridium curvatum]|uniref:Uncharacterized protein n=1 Tax=Thyridium curvatum TaxID=1093900 RepID=A0A507AP52_9PEZI|nr:uncharacterized protein E0L32_001809 [Thyridium curvatum]XP_030990006.1 uncharacterized protein E0L32_001870 [Thyridium curvatum]TPX08234.1 hypothetical protein E0L32_001809 [Thyridium curvatum]TPX08295.1 hypothetical protein E0L32_001870 [Thyridium curvatum]
MAAITSSSFASSAMMNYGRSGYNNKPDGDDKPKNQGRSGYNKGDKDDDDE